MPFFRLHDRRYTVYWDSVGADECARRLAVRAAEKARLADRDARTMDRVQPGVEASESAHALKSERSRDGSGAYGQHPQARWRDAAEGWFQYQMAVRPGQPVDLVCTYWGREKGERTFDLLVNGTKVATQTLDGHHPETFYDVTSPVPQELLQDKSAVTVRFQAHPGNTAGGLFGLRTVQRR